jgi:hypothetical protein
MRRAYYKRTLQASATLRRLPVAYPAPPRIGIWADCACTASHSRVVRKESGIYYSDVFDELDELEGAKCKKCLSLYYVRIQGALGRRRR